MIIARLLAGMIAVMSMSAVVPTLTTSKNENKERDARIIVEVNRGLDGMTKEQIESSQKLILNRIRSNVTSNIEFVQSYSVLNNAFCIEVNSSNIEAIKSLPGVASVTVDKLHARQAIGEGSTYSATLHGRKALDPNRNISANTMEKPDITNDGEGTVIAILDNEFFLRGSHTESDDCSFHKYGCDGNAIYHEVYTDLEDSVHVKFTFDNLTATLKKTNARRKSGKVAGEEGSLYFNKKVPFYYDYGGESTSYGKAGKMDYDVSSIITYHGSHVASIAAANAPTYKGISPKAQLACMKVFTNYKADETSKNLGFGDSSGAYDSCILSALEDCITLGVDGINMSLGSDLDDFDSNSITLKTLSNLADGGILTAISAGNSGKTSYAFAGGYGNWTRDMVETGIMSSYANNKTVMTIASGQPDEVFYETAIKLGTVNVQYEDQIVNREGYDADFNVEYRLADLPKDAEGKVGWVYVPGFGTAADYTGIDVEGKVAVVNRGSTSFADKYATAKDNGAIGLIIINNDPTASDFNFRCSFGDDFMPSMPCALVLFKDKLKFQTPGSGMYSYITKEVSDNGDKRTMSTFSTDGATFDLDLKPEITAPGDIIRGAVPPQKKEDKELTPLSTYEYLSGTSMSAPNYAGAQALVVSSKAKDVYDNQGNVVSTEAAKELAAYKKTVDMRLMSTANPMLDASNNPETNVKNYSSPRLQGAGMVDLTGALNTKVYLQGKDLKGNVINKSKVCLGNNEDIAKGNIKLAFNAINEDSASHLYDIKLTVMRPAIKSTNEVIAKEYNYRSEIDDVKYLPGVKYYDADLGRVVSSSGNASYKDVFKLTKQIEYYPTEESYEAHEPIIMAQGNWYVASQGQKQTSNVRYEVLPNYDYQSTQDVVIYEDVVSSNVEIPAGKSEVVVPTYSLTAEQKADIQKYYEYGCMIEGYVTLVSKDGEPDLNLPYLGFYSLADKTEGQSYKDAPIVEPFEFEKDKSKIYASELVNDISVSLLGKDNVDFGSSWVIGYADNPENVNLEKVLTNDMNLKMLPGFHPIGTDPETETYSGDVMNNLYVGNPEKSNTMIIQQFVMRSVNDNFFTIKNEAGQTVYKSVLEDSLFGDQYGRYPLYKSHVDSSYLSAGYVAHRAWAKVPLYNTETGEKFADGNYTIEFNYQLVGCGNSWVSKQYNFKVDSTAAEFLGAKQFAAEDGTQMVRFEFKDEKLSYGTIGYQLVDFEYDSTKGVYYLELTKEEIDSIIEEIGESSYGYKRLYLQAVDKAFGETGVVIHFTDPNDYSKLESISGSDVKVNYDFKHDEHSITYIVVDSKTGVETEVSIKNAKHTGFDIKPVDPTPVDPTNNTNLALILGLSIGGGVLLIGGGVLAFFLIRRKKLVK